MHLYFTNRLFQKKIKDQLFFDQQERIDFVGNCLEHVFRPDISALFGVQRKMKVHGLIEREAFWAGLGRVKAGVIVSMEYTDMRKVALLSKLIGTSSSGFEALPILRENRNPQMKWFRVTFEYTEPDHREVYDKIFLNQDEKILPAYNMYYNNGKYTLEIPVSSLTTSSLTEKMAGAFEGDVKFSALAVEYVQNEKSVSTCLAGLRFAEAVHADIHFFGRKAKGKGKGKGKEKEVKEETEDEVDEVVEVEDSGREKDEGKAEKEEVKEEEEVREEKEVKEEQEDKEKEEKERTEEFFSALRRRRELMRESLTKESLKRESQRSDSSGAPSRPASKRIRIQAEDSLIEAEDSFDSNSIKRRLEVAELCLTVAVERVDELTAELAKKDAELAKKDEELAKKDEELAKKDEAILKARVLLQKLGAALAS